MANPTLGAIRSAQAVERIARLVRERENEAGLQPAQWEALRCLAASNRFSRSPSAVAVWLATTRGTASQTLMALERKGLVSRAGDPDDRRASRLELTDAGQAMLDRDPLASVAASVARLPPLHAVALGQSLAQVLDDLLGAAGRGGFHACAGCRNFAAAPQGEGGHCARFDAAMDAREAGRACIAHRAA